MRVCHFCKAVLDETAKVYRASICPSCSKELKICLNCRFYSPGAHWECLESIPEPVTDKERSNFCDYFQFRDSPARGQDRPTQRHDQAKQDFGRLFGDRP
jgi:hypothetical protein